MVQLQDNQLVFSFPDVHPDAVLRINFQQTLRIPDDDGIYPLPPGLGRFPLRRAHESGKHLREPSSLNPTVMLPMYQSQALWIHFDAQHDYPFAVKVATGEINAATGEPSRDGLQKHPQDYLAVPEQPWLDGYCVDKGIIRQFVAMPLGRGYTVEEQLTGIAKHGGLQLLVFPMKAAAYERLCAERKHSLETHEWACCLAESPASLGLAAGGRMKQEIYEDPYGFDDWELQTSQSCSVHIVNAHLWPAITGELPPANPPTAHDYARAGLPWFDFYASDLSAIEGSPILERVKSVNQLGEEKREALLPENKSAVPTHVITLGPTPVASD